jgi:hypothetical protein
MTKRLRHKQLQAIELMAVSGFDSQDIIKMLKLRWSTLSRWRRQPEFIARLEECKQELLEDAEYNTDRLTQRLAWKATAGIENELFGGVGSPKAVETTLKVLKQITGVPKRAETRQNVPKEVKTQCNMPDHTQRNQ